MVVRYGFGDASGVGYGLSIYIEGRGILWETGLWEWSIKEESSSNYKKLRNIVDALQKYAQDGWLQFTEIWMFTDNSVAESAYFRGTSKSRQLFELVLQLRKLEMAAECRIFLIHVAGTRMIAQGTDGLSRGDQNAGVMMGVDMLDYILLHRTAVERSPSVETWVHSWAGPSETNTYQCLSENEWPLAHPSRGTYVWYPAPAAAPAAVEWLACSIHKRVTSIHIMIVPRLMTAWWFKILNKTADLIFKILTTTEIWGKNEHEPLICALCLPLSSKDPWSHKGSERTLQVHRELHSVWLSDFGRARVILRQLLGEARFLSQM